MGTHSCAQIHCPGTSTNWHLEKSAPRLLLIFHFPTFVIVCAESAQQKHTCQWLQLQEENAIVTYICVRFPPASSKNGWRAYTKSSKLVFSSPPSCNPSSSYRLFVRRNCRNLATILGLSFPPWPPQQSLYVPSQNEPPPPLRPISWLHSDFPASWDWFLDDAREEDRLIITKHSTRSVSRWAVHFLKLPQSFLVRAALHHDEQMHARICESKNLIVTR